MLPFSDDFARANGLLGNGWSGATWAIVSGAAVNTPTLGSELLSNPGFENNNPPANWTKYGNPPTYEQSNADTHGGTYALHVVSSAAAQGAFQGPAVAAGTWYRLSGWQKVVSGNADIITNLAHWSPGLAQPGGATWAQVTQSNLALGTNGYVYSRSTNAGAGEHYADDMSLKAITLSSLLICQNRRFANVGAVKAAWNILSGNPAGVVGWWDGVTPMQNCLLAYHNGYKVSMLKFVGANRTELIVPTTVAYVAGYSPEIRRVPGTNTFRLYYGTTKVGTDQTINDVEIVNNQYFGLFSTHPGNQCLSFYLNPSGYTAPNLALTDDPNYIVQTGIESTLLTDGNQVDMWYEVGGNLKYATTTDPTLRTWTIDNVTLLANNYYHAVAKHPSNGLYYMICQPVQNGAGDLYMYSSPDKTTWTITNNGDPVMTHSADANAWGYALFNSSFMFVGDTIHFIVEGQSQNGVTVSSRFGYATSTLAAGPNFNTNMAVIVNLFSVTPDLHYLPERDAFLLFGCDVADAHMRIVVWCASGADDLALAASWRKMPHWSFASAGIHIGDPSACELPSYFSYPMLLSYNYDQHAENGVGRQANSLSQAYGTRTLVAFYDALLREV